MMDFVQNSDPFEGSFTELAQLTLDDSESEIVDNQFEVLKEEDDAIDVYSDELDDVDSEDSDELVDVVSDDYSSELVLDSDEDTSDDNLFREDFLGHKSAWDGDALEVRREVRLRRKVESIMNGNFSESDMLDEASPVSKSSRKKQAKKDKKLKKVLLKTQAEIRTKRSNNLEKAIRSQLPKEGILSFLKQVNRQVHDFVIKDQDTSMILPPMPGFIRRVVCELCKSYYVTPKMRGSKQKKLIVVFRTGLARVPDNWQYLPSALETKHDLKPTPFYKDKRQSPRNDKKSSKATTKGKIGAPNTAAQPKVGDVIGATAQPIEEGNRGRRMLQAMGWKEGESLGANDSGVKDPLQVTVRAKRAGLGGV
jgi:hypothetical protein